VSSWEESYWLRAVNSHISRLKSAVRYGAPQFVEESDSLVIGLGICRKSVGGATGSGAPYLTTAGSIWGLTVASEFL
jgi:hypothetical protein